MDARYVLREWKNGDKAEVIYETDNPAQGAVYTFWGYWLTWGELAGSMIVLLILFQVAVAITKNPTPESLMEQLEPKTEKKRRYKE